jgi:Leucine-rich repeat (LRR) protein
VTALLVVVVAMNAPLSPLLRAQYPLWVNGQNADYVIGQPHFDIGTLGGGSQGLNNPQGVAIDAVNGKLYVADASNHRVLRFAYPLNANQPSAEIVFGQADFLGISPNRGGTVAANTLSAPEGLAVINGTLWVADRGNHRLLRFNNAYAIATNGPNADVVLGQTAFSLGMPSLAANRLNSPRGICFDAAGNLYVADYNNRRVLRFGAASLSTIGANADLVIGQADFTSNVLATSASRFDSPQSLAIGADGSLYVSMPFENRILRFANVTSLSGSPDPSAVAVFGQLDFFSTGSGTGANQFTSNVGIACIENDLFVCDFNNRRVVIFLQAHLKPTVNPFADYVLGPSEFGTPGPMSITRSSVAGGRWIAVDSRLGVERVLVSSVSSHSVRQFSPPPRIVPTSIAPPRNAAAAQPTAIPSFVFSTQMTSATVNTPPAAFPAPVGVWGSLTGYRTVTRSLPAGTAMTLTPNQPFLRGERVFVNVTNAQRLLQANTDLLLNPPQGGSMLSTSATWLFDVGASGGIGTFHEVARPPTGTGVLRSTSVATGDFDRDGDIDCAAANFNNASITIFTNNGSGALTAAQTLTSGLNPVFVHAADMNNDGFLDLLVANAGTGSISLYLNNSGVFPTSPTSFHTAAGNPVHIATADFDGNGLLDVAVANAAGSGSVTILRNRVLGGLQTAGVEYLSMPFSFASCRALACGDWDNDGDIDIAVANGAFPSNYVSFMRNSGGNFEPAGTILTGALGTLVSLCSGDLDNDGDLDLAVVSGVGGGGITNNLTVLLNNSAANTYDVSFTSSFYTIPSGTSAVVCGDWDGDNDLDLAATCWAGGTGATVSVIQNNGGGIFAVLPANTIATGRGPRGLAVGDIDGDGDLDLLSANDPNDPMMLDTGTLSVLLNTAPITVLNYNTTPTVAPARHSNSAPLSATCSITFTQPLASTVATAGSRVLFVQGSMRGSRSGTFSTPGPATLTLQPAMAFYSGEQVWVSVTHARSVANVPTRPFVYSYRAAAALGTGLLQEIDQIPTANINPRITATGDFNNDGALDYAVAQNGGIQAFLNSGSGQSFTGGSLLGGLVYTQMAVADFNNDGNLDIVAITAAGVNHILLGNGAGGFSVNTITPSSGSAPTLAVADFNGDGLMDFATAANPQFNMYLNNGSGTSFTNSNASFGTDKAFMAAGDFDNDGDIDLAVANSMANVQLLLNNGNGVFTGGALLLTPAPRAITAADVNNDGRTDIVLATQTSVFVYINSGAVFAPGMAVLTGRTDVGTLAAADVNGDGRLDILAADNLMGGMTNGVLAVVLNTSSGYTSLGAFRAGQMPTGNTAALVAYGDFNNDGTMDAVLPNFNGQSVSLMINAGRMFVQGTVNSLTGQAITGGTVPVVPPRNAAATASASVSIPFSESTSTGTVPNGASILRVHGSLSGYKSGSYTLSGTSPANNTLSFTPSRPFLSNEHVWVSVTHARSTAFLRTRPFAYGFRARSGVGPGTFVPLSETGVGVAPRSLAVADLNGDGLAEVITADSADNSITILRNTAGVLSQSSRIAVNNPIHLVSAADIDGDGRTDILAAVRSGGLYTVAALRNLGSLNFDAPVTAAGAAVGIPTGMWAGDVDIDGDLDLVIASHAAGTMTLFRNDAGLFTAWGIIPSPTHPPRFVAGGDFDGDGDLDLVTAGDNLVLWANTMNPSFTPPPQNLFIPSVIVSSGVGAVRGIACTDLDGDTDLDIAVSGSSLLAAHLNLGSGTLAAPIAITISAGGGLSSFAMGDVDGDTDMDFVFTNRLQNNLIAGLTGGSANTSALPTGAEPQDVTLADTDGDGDLDAVVLSQSRNSVLLLSNRQTVSLAASPVMPTTPGELTFGAVEYNRTVERFVGISASNLLSPVTVSLVGVDTTQVRLAAMPGSMTTSTSLTIPAGGGSVMTQIVVRYTASTSAALSGFVLVTTQSASPVAISISGQGEILPPQIMAFTPSSAISGSQVTITGRNFYGVQRVLFGGVPAESFTVSSTTQIVAVVGLDASGPITVQTIGGTATSAQSFTILSFPSIVSFAPVFGTTGTVVTLNGSQLGTATQVFFGERAAQSFTILSTTSVQAVAPVGIITAPLRVSTPIATVTSATAFTVTQPPSIASVQPTVAIAGTSLAITGINFTGTTTVTLGGATVASFSVASPTLITAVLATNHSTGVVSVSNPSGTAMSGVVEFVHPPVVSAISPTLGGTGTVVTITGQHFTNISNVLLGGMVVPFQVVNATTLTITVVNQSGFVTVTNVAGFASSTNAFTLIPAPQIAAFTPTTGSTGSTVIITGSAFVNVDSVRFGGIKADSFRVESATRIVAFVSAQGASGRVQVFTKQGQSTSEALFTFVQLAAPPPRITTISPVLGYTGDVVVINGMNFGGATFVRFGDSAAASFTVESSTRIRATVGKGTTGTVQVVTPSGIAVSAQIFTHLGAPPTQTDGDQGILERFYVFTNGDAWTVKTNWRTSMPLNRWFGVTTDVVQGVERVVRLELPANSITGELPSFLAGLTALRVLNLSGNRLSGTIPSSIATMSALHELRLSSNRFSGAIPDSIGSLRALRILALDSNALSGALPTSLCSMNTLEELRLGSNRLAGALPACLASFAALRVLDVSNNQHSGTLPNGLATLVQLQTLNLSRNQFTGTLAALFSSTSATLHSTLFTKPSTKLSTALLADKSDHKQALTATTTLTVLDVSNNRLSGELPNQLWQQTSLRELLLSRNRFAGSIPPAIGSLRSLQVLEAQASGLSGAIPSALATLDSLRILALDSNAFTGAVPALFSEVVRLRTLGLSWNRLTSVPPIPRPVTTLRLEGNSLDFGSIEPQIFPNRFVSYVPQDSIGRQLDTTALLGSQFTVTLRTGGSLNQYQWFKGREALAEQRNPVLAIERFAARDTGTYFCRVTNQSADSLTLWSRAVRIAARLPEPPQTPPTLLSPANGEVNTSLTPTLRWSSVTDASAYTVELSTVEDFSTLVTTATTEVQVSTGSQQQAPLSHRVSGLRNLTRYFWRVRSVNAGGVSRWSAVWSFTTISDRDVLLASPVDFGRVVLSSTARATLVIVNPNASAITLRAAELTETSMAQPVSSTIPFRLGLSLVNVRLNAGDSLRLPIEYAPRQPGEHRASLTVRYTLEGSSIEQTTQLSNILLGRAGVLHVEAPSFDTVVVGRDAFRTMLLVNRSAQSVLVRSVNITNTRTDDGFSIIGASSFRLATGDTVAIGLRCSAQRPGRISATLVLDADIDNFTLPLSAVAREFKPTDVAMTIGIRPRIDTPSQTFSTRQSLQTSGGFFPLSPRSAGILPGDVGFIELFIVENTPDALATYNRALLPPTFEALVTFDNSVLALEPDTSATVVFERSSGTVSGVREVVVRGRWDGRTGSNIIGYFRVRGVLGATDSTALTLKNFQWADAERAARTTGSLILVSTSAPYVIRTNVCVTDGQERLLKPSLSTGISHLTTTPDGNEIVIHYTLRERGWTSLILYDVMGRAVRPLFAGNSEYGNFELHHALHELPSGMYTLVLSTPSKQVARSVRVIK